ncbi:hypothetical protein P3X46_031873 [Hevea brasiliensis]|uniref:Pentacotripeptide-repeat region of PRORP domain-containing protein n=1 Tax=Hevea brasiliensis TaxID=3981 RepID=A0ABQ9KLR4_HEVBR|nr:pentatricopeptide repeat-containing protein At5g57250, mitochondrial [Hevea brasiliensis]KAJ9141329.1 hypothetical protein P3X46_031873 [Hevea brasiliensis]
MYVYNAVNLLCKRNFFMGASEFYKLARRNKSILSSKSYYWTIRGLFNDGKFQESQPFLCSFVKEYGLFEPKVSKILLHYLCLKDVDSALYFLNKIKENNITITLPISALRALAKFGSVLDTYKLVVGAKDDLPVMDLVDYSIMVDGLCKIGHPIKALKICAFAEMKGIVLNIITYNSIINGLCNQGCFVEAFRLFDSLERIDLVPSEITYSTLIDNLCKEGYLLDAKQLFERMTLKGYKVNIRIYNSFLNGYCNFGQFEEALEILKNIEIEHLDPDEFTVSSMINGYCQKGDLEGALNFFFKCKQNSIYPDFLGFLHLMRGLCAKGRMEEARSILREMLQSQSVMEMLNRVNTAVETESIQSFLVFLCEQGSIKEAVTVLNEVGSMFFPVQKFGPCESQELEKLSESEAFDVFASRTVSHERTDLGFTACDVMKGGKKIEKYDDLGKSEIEFFDSYYSLIASLCSRGELCKANRLAMEILSAG